MKKLIPVLSRMLSMLVNLFLNLVLWPNASIPTFSLYCFSAQITRKGLVVLRRWFCSYWFAVHCCSNNYCGVLWEERAGCFTLFVFPVSWALPHRAVGCSAMWGCGIFWSYSLNFSYSSILLRFSKRLWYGLSRNS